MAEVATAADKVPITVVVGSQDPAILARCRALLADVEEIDIASAVEDQKPINSGDKRYNQFVVGRLGAFCRE